MRFWFREPRTNRSRDRYNNGREQAGAELARFDKSGSLGRSQNVPKVEHKCSSRMVGV